MWKYNDELYHYGVLGMKWGKRRFQRPDGTLTSAGKKRVSKAYEKAQSAGDKDLAKSYEKMYVDSHNRVADKMNNGGINKFNAQSKKKYGNDYAKKSEYERDFSNLYEKEMQKELNKSLNAFLSTNPNYQKATKLVNDYGMEKWNDLAKSNSEGIRQMRSQLED